LAGIRTMALSLVLLEHMQDKQHVQRLKEVFLLAMMSGTLADELTPAARAHDEPFLAGMMGQLGRMLTEFYFPEEAALVRRRVEPAWQRGEWTHAIEDRAVSEVLGLSYEQLGVGVAKAWGLPDTLRRAMERPEGSPPARAVDAPGERLRWAALAAGELANALLQVPQALLPAKIGQIGERYARALDLPREQFEAAVRTAQSHLNSMSADLGIDVRSDARARRLLAQPLAVPTGNHDPATIAAAAAAAASVAPMTGAPSTAAAADATQVFSREPVPGAGTADAPVAAAPAGGTAPESGAVPPVDAAARAHALEDGIASVTQALAGDSFRLNEVLRTILEAMHRSIGFRCVMFGLRDPKTGIITGRFGIGRAAEAFVPRFRVDVNPNGPVDLLSVACKKAADTLISDAAAANVRSRLPTWLQREEGARSFVLLPMTMKSAPFALIYGDAATAGGIILGERDLSLLRTLRNQAVMAFKTAA
jgi:hypothetical protein